jgi:hypothetical protein
MTTQAEALKLALEVLERIDLWLKARYSGIGLVGVELDAITAIKEALAQLEHEKERCVGCEACIDTACGRDECPKGWPKAAQPEQEPVACIEDGDLYFSDEIDWQTLQQQGIAVQLLYTTPPQRTWVELTEEDMDWLVATTPCIEGSYGYRFIKAIEAKLKEKNT